MSEKGLMTNYDVVRKLIGSVGPVGETREDERRLQNLRSLIDLVDALVVDIVHVAQERDAHEASVKMAGKTADDFLAELFESLEERRDTPPISAFRKLPLFIESKKEDCDDKEEG